MFTEHCFIRKITPELKKRLEDIGYRYVKSISKNDAEKKYIYCACGKFSFEGLNFIQSDKCAVYCESEELFLAIASLRNDSDKHQWFICNNEHMTPKLKVYKTGEFQLCEKDKAVINKIKPAWRKATVKELIEYFKK